MKTLIRHATVVLPDEMLTTSVLIDGQRIAAIDAAVHAAADEVVDARGLHLLPGVIDDQVHFREPGLTHKEDLETASRACAKGGVTTFLDMPNTRPTYDARSVAGREAGLGGREEPGELRVLHRRHAAESGRVAEQGGRTPGIKIFIGSSTGDLLVDRQEDLERIFAETTLPICTHCEDEATVRANQERLRRHPGRRRPFADPGPCRRR